jgi:hypothetical protein
MKLVTHIYLPFVAITGLATAKDGQCTDGVSYCGHTLRNIGMCFIPNFSRWLRFRKLG